MAVRTESALQTLAAALSAAGYEPTVSGSKVVVYDPNAGKKNRMAGFVTIKADGTVDRSKLTSRAGSITDAWKICDSFRAEVAPGTGTDYAAVGSAIRRGDASLTYSDAEIAEAVRLGHATESAAMNQDT